MKIKIFFLLIVSALIPIYAWAMGTDIPNGRYQVNVALWHAYEDKSSMGDQGLDRIADLVVSDGKMDIYLQMKTLSVGEIKTSVTHVYYPDNSKQMYILSDMYAFDIEIPNETLKRPRVFKLRLDSKDELTNILVDPKVAAMGVDPIKARLKIDWNSLKPVSEDDEGPYKIAMNTKDSVSKMDSITLNNVRITDSDGITGEIVVSPIVRANLEKDGLSLSLLDKVKGYSVLGTEVVREIAFDGSKPVKSTDIPLGEKAVIEFLGENDITEVQFFTENGAKEIPFVKNENSITIENAKFGRYALIKRAENSPSVSSGKDDEASESKEQNNPSVAPKLPKLTKNQPKPVQSIKDGSRQPSRDSATSDSPKALSSEKEEKVPVSQTGDTTMENSKIQFPFVIRESKGIIVAVLLVYTIFFVIGVILLKAYVAKLMDELERRRYLSFYSIKGGAENEN